MSHDLKSWTEEKKSWVFVLSDLFEQMFGTDFLTYCFDKDHGTKVDDSKKCEIFEYYHEYWKKHFSRESPEPQDNTVIGSSAQAPKWQPRIFFVLHFCACF